MKYINLFFILILFGCNNNSLNTIQLTERCVIDEDLVNPAKVINNDPIPNQSIIFNALFLLFNCELISV